MLRWQVFVATQRLWSLCGWKLRICRDDPLSHRTIGPLMFEKHIIKAFVLNLFILGFIWVIHKWFGYNVVSIYLLSSPILYDAPRLTSIFCEIGWNERLRGEELSVVDILTCCCDMSCSYNDRWMRGYVASWIPTTLHWNKHSHRRTKDHQSWLHHFTIPSKYEYIYI